MKRAREKRGRMGWGGLALGAVEDGKKGVGRGRVRGEGGCAAGDGLWMLVESKAWEERG